MARPMSHMTITLDDGARLPNHKVDDDTPGWWIDGNTVTTRTDMTTAVYRLPKGRPRVVMQRLGNRRSQLIIGGYTTTTVAVNGPADTIRKLREAVL